MRDRAVEDGQFGGGLEASSFGLGQPQGQVSAAKRRGDGHLLDDGRLGPTPVATELGPGVAVSAHSDATDHTDRDETREDVQREQSGALSAPSATGHALPSREGPGGNSNTWADAGCVGQTPGSVEL